MAIQPVVEERQKWRFTFGCGQAHYGYCQPIIGTFNSARKKMFELYGAEWAFQYSEEEWQKIIDNPNRYWAIEEDLEVIEV